MRTTVDIEDTVLKEVRALQRREGRTLGEVVSGLLAAALAQRPKPAVPALEWTSRPMEGLVDLEDKEVVYAILDRPARAAEP